MESRSDLFQPEEIKKEKAPVEINVEVCEKISIVSVFQDKEKPINSTLTEELTLNDLPDQERIVMEEDLRRDAEQRKIKQQKYDEIHIMNIKNLPKALQKKVKKEMSNKKKTLNIVLEEVAERENMIEIVSGMEHFFQEKYTVIIEQNNLFQPKDYPVKSNLSKDLIPLLKKTKLQTKHLIYLMLYLDRYFQCNTDKSLSADLIAAFFGLVLNDKDCSKSALKQKIVCSTFNISLNKLNKLTVQFSKLIKDTDITENQCSTMENELLAYQERQWAKDPQILEFENVLSETKKEETNFFIDKSEEEKNNLLIPAIASSLELICKKNVKLTEKENEKRKNGHMEVSRALFRSKSIPEMSIESYLMRLITYASGDPLIAMMYLNHYLMIPSTGENFNDKFLNEYVVHRLLLICFFLSAKVWEDNGARLSLFAKVGGVSVEELRKLEAGFLFLINFNLVSDEAYHSIKKHLSCLSNNSLAQDNQIKFISQATPPVCPNSSASSSVSQNASSTLNVSSTTRLVTIKSSSSVRLFSPSVVPSTRVSANKILPSSKINLLKSEKRPSGCCTIG